MKVYLYMGLYKLVRMSGIGKAVCHQMEALKETGVPYTTNRGDEYDIIHLNTIFPDSYLMAKWAKKRGKKVIYYGHSTMEDFRNSFRGSNLFAPLFKFWIKKCYSSADVVITPTDYSRRLLEGYGIERPIYSLSNGIDLRQYRCDEGRRKRFREKYGIGHGAKVVLSVGHYIERKGIMDFIELSKKFPEYQFYWFGYTQRELVEKNIQKAIDAAGSNLHFPGYVEQDEMLDAYAGSDLFLFMTHEETEGIVMLEAMAMQIPILVRDIPIYETWLPDREVVYKAGCFEEFVQRVPEILEGQVPNLTDAAYRVVSHNDLPVIGRRLQEIYEENFAGEVQPAYIRQSSDVSEGSMA